MKLFHIQFIFKSILISSILFFSIHSQAQWRQVGQKIVDTTVTNSSYGLSVAISPDGSTFVGASTDANKGAWICSINGTNIVKIGNIKIPETVIVTSKSFEFGQGQSISIASDNKTFIIGYPAKGNPDQGIPDGEASVFSFNGVDFLQVGNKFNGIDHLRMAISTIPGQGKSVSISGDGKVAILGAHGKFGYDGKAEIGAAWIFTFNGSNYVQLGSELQGTGTELLSSKQGYSVAISRDGKTAIVGGILDSASVGSAWVYTFNGDYFTQVGNKLKSNDHMGIASFGSSVSLSNDGKTAIIGGYIDDEQTGAAWIFTFNGINYIQLGKKLIGNDYAKPRELTQDPPPRIGNSVCISGDGRTAIIGGTWDSTYVGAAWIYTFNGVDFEQSGPKLIGSGSAGDARQGNSVAISDDGKRVIIAGIADHDGDGAAWIFALCEPAKIESMCIDSNRVLTIEASSIFPMEYQWYRDITLLAVTTTSSYNIDTTIVPNQKIYGGVVTNGCKSATAPEIDIKDLIGRPIIGDSAICKGDSVHLSVRNMKSLTWYNGDTLKSIALVPFKDTTVSFSGVNKQNCPIKSFLTITVNSPMVLLDLSSFDNYCDTLNSIKLTGGTPLGGYYTYSNTQIEDLNISKSGFYAISYNYSDTNKCFNYASDTILVIHCVETKFKIYSSFTPNSDGSNDTWIIDALPIDNNLVIVDKWGTEVFRTNQYNNDWKGTHQNGKKLVPGVYYYFLDVIPQNKIYTGAVTIIY